ncbi:hypothetical protein Vadar_012517 [Vaccinium darrowii]|uniref:Uncharacterized protein n=1 Tax=Vaccinium darrowii TaxID=229202 RepID=A0ACB7ZBS7_9ERIC|nr:hypothetical protein Vadar_012517 [Vaccinium darrowii]
MAALSPAISNNSTADAPSLSPASASTPASISTGGLSSTNASKNLRGLNKPKCIKCGNVARSRCPYQSCKSCCAKAQNPCHIHVLKSNATFSDKTQSSSSPLFDQQSSEASPSGVSSSYALGDSGNPVSLSPLVLNEMIALVFKICYLGFHRYSLVYRCKEHALMKDGLLSSHSSSKRNRYPSNGPAKLKVPCSPGNCVSEVLVSVGASGGRDIPLARDLRALLDDFPPLPVGPFRTGPSFTRAAG